MPAVQVRSYLSPTLVLLAFNWEEGKNLPDFLGFAIQRTPGFNGRTPNWLPNRLSFQPGSANGNNPSNQAPIQKFMWWDAQINTKNRGKTFTYKVIPVQGSPQNLKLIDSAAREEKVTIPEVVRGGIGSWFNRAVISSQAFSREFGDGRLSNEKLEQAKAWLANGMEQAIPSFLEDSSAADMVIYHLTDDNWVIPSIEEFNGPLSIVYYYKAPPSNPNSKSHGDTESDDAVKSLVRHPNIRGMRRTRTSIMHDKFIVRREQGTATGVLTGSANFTEEGITSQANVIHTFDSPELVALYEARFRLLEEDPTKTTTAKQSTAWSSPVEIGGAKIRVFFPPEQKAATGTSVSIGTIIQRVNNAKSSVVFCCMDITDLNLLNAMFKAGDDGKLMFGLVNRIPMNEPGTVTGKKASPYAVEIYHRSQDNKDVFSYGSFSGNVRPAGFLDELHFKNLKGKTTIATAIFIHHKFVVIDAETDNPTVYVGSANLSNNSTYNNDENMLEITASPDIAQMYLAEFMRLYEHYRARAIAQRVASGLGKPETLVLSADSSWAKLAYQADQSAFKSRVDLAKQIN
jgi:phosphatidylserine/phosphatidylglycerophosphate/cardiolipin synthase-like enzyme